MYTSHSNLDYPNSFNL